MATLGGKMYLIPMHWPAAVAGKVGEVVTVNKQTRYRAALHEDKSFVFMYATLDCDTFAFLR